MPLTTLDLDEIFKYHPPDEDDRGKYERLRDAAKAFATVVLRETASSPDQSVAIRKIREAVMAANSSIALKGKY